MNDVFNSLVSKVFMGGQRRLIHEEFQTVEELEKLEKKLRKNPAPRLSREKEVRKFLMDIAA